MRASITGARLARVARRLPPSAECRDQVRAVPPLSNHRRGWEGKGTGAEPVGMVSFVTSLRLPTGRDSTEVKIATERERQRCFESPHCDGTRNDPRAR
jgi:hypothetical protein